MKQCTKCKEIKDFTNFYKHHSTKDKLSTYCRTCYLETCRNSHYKKRYGLTSEEADSMKNECEICKVTHNLNIDHNHSTNKVRGVLCSNCNRGIGHLQDSPVLLQKAIQYLEKHGHYSKHD